MYIYIFTCTYIKQRFQASDVQYLKKYINRSIQNSELYNTEATDQS